MRRSLAPLLFEDDDPEGARAKQSSPVAQAEVSDRALDKAGKKKTPDGLPVHSMATLLADLATFTMTPEPTKLQAKAFELLKIKPEKYVAM